MDKISEETAVTENITYNTQECRVCGTEVATDSAAPANTFEPHGYAVILGSGDFRQEIEYNGNWDRKLIFESTKEDTLLPNVEAHIICENCAQSIHGHPEVAQNYTGNIPRNLQPIRKRIKSKTKIITIIIIATLSVLILLLLLSLLL